MNTLADKTSINPKKRWFYLVFILVNLFLSCYYLDVWMAPQGGSRGVPVLTMYEDKTIVVDKYKDFAMDISVVNNHTYSNKAPLSSFLVYPFYSLYKSLGLPDLKDTTLKKYPIYIYSYKAPDGIDHNPDARGFMLPKLTTVLILGDILCGAIPFVLALLLSLYAIKRTSSKLSPVVVVMMSFYASFLFAYAGTYTGHILSGIFALTGYIYLKKKNYIISGIMVGLAMATEFPVAVLVPVWAVLIYLNEKKISKSILFGLGLIPGVIVVLWYNYHLTGSITKTPYNFEVHQEKQDASQLGFNAPTFQAFWGLVFSTYRGVLFYTPVFILMLWYFFKFGYQNSYKDIKNKMTLVSAGIKNYLLLTIIAYLVLYSCYYQWPGGWAFGPRYLIPMVMIVMYEGVIFLSDKKISPYLFYIITGLSLLFTWMDKSTKIYMLPDFPQDYEKMGLNASQLQELSRYHNPLLSIVLPDFMQHHFNANMLPVFLFDSSPSLAIHLWPILFIVAIVLLTRWYSKLFPVPIEVLAAKPKLAPKKANKK